jgi:hypothetical protein
MIANSFTRADPNDRGMWAVARSLADSPRDRTSQNEQAKQI